MKQLSIAPRLQAPSDSYRWTILALLSANNCAGVFLGISLGLLLPVMLIDIPMTPVEQGWLSASVRLGSAALSLPAAWWLSRYNPWAVTAAAAAVGALLIFGQAIAPAYGLLLAARGGFGLMVLASQPARALLIRQWFPDRNIVLVNGIFSFVVGITEFGSGALAPYLEVWLGGWRPTLGMVGVWALVAAVLWLAFGRVQPSDARRALPAAAARPPIWAVVRYRQLWLAGGGAAGGTALWSTFATFWPGYMYSTYGLPLTTLGFFFGLESLGMAPASLLFGYLASRFGLGRRILVGCGLTMAVLSLLMLQTGSLPILIAAGLAIGFAWGFAPIVITVPFELPGVAPREVAVAAAFVSSMFAIGSVVGPVVAGALIEVTGSTSLALSLMCLCPLSIGAAGLRLRSSSGAGLPSAARWGRPPDGS